MNDPVTPEKPIQQQPPVIPWWVLPGLAVNAELIFAIGLWASFAFGNETQQTTMLTAAITLALMAGGFFFQSSLGSQKNQETMARISLNASSTGPQT